MDAFNIFKVKTSYLYYDVYLAVIIYVAKYPPVVFAEYNYVISVGNLT